MRTTEHSAKRELELRQRNQERNIPINISFIWVLKNQSM